MEAHKSHENIGAIFAKVLTSAGEIYADILNLAALEARLAGKSLLLITCLFFCCLLFLSTAWIFLMVLCFWALIPWLGGVYACLIVVMSNLTFILLLLLLVRSLSKNLQFRKTRKNLLTSN